MQEESNLNKTVHAGILLLGVFFSFGFSWLFLEVKELKDNNENITKDSADRGWTVEVHDDLVYNTTRGSNVWGHKFGSFKKKGNCDGNTLFITWSSFQESVHAIKGQNVPLEIEVDNRLAKISIELLTTFQATPSMVLMTFTNFFVTDEFIEFLESSNSVDVRIAGPIDIMKHFDIVQETFSLQGFKESNKRAIEACQGKAQPARLQFI